MYSRLRGRWRRWGPSFWSALVSSWRRSYTHSSCLPPTPCCPPDTCSNTFRTSACWKNKHNPVNQHSRSRSVVPLLTSHYLCGVMAHSDRTYVGTGTGPGPEWVTVYYVKPSHCNLSGQLNGSYTLALYQSRSHSHISSVWMSHKRLLACLKEWKMTQVTPKFDLARDEAQLT